MEKQYKQLEIAGEITNKIVGNFIRGFYHKEVLTPYLKKSALDFINNCRYRQDDVRPLLVKLGYELNGGKNIKEILPAMSAIHLLLIGFMPVDDIIDGATKQDFKSPTQFSKKLALAYSLSTKLKENGRKILRENYQNHPNFIKIDKLISECLEKLDASHSLEVVFHSKKPIRKYSLRDYKYLVDEATSILIAVPLLVGALIAKTEVKKEKAFWDFGMNLGRLIQIRDDFLDYINPKITGKLSFADLSEKRKRFPLLLAYKTGNNKTKEKINKMITKKTEITKRDVLFLMEIISQEDFKQKTLEITNPLYKKAQNNLKELKNKSQAYVYLNKMLDLFSMK